MKVRTTTVRTHLCQGLSALALVSTIMLVLAGCEGSGSNAAANAGSRTQGRLTVRLDDC